MSKRVWTAFEKRTFTDKLRLMPLVPSWGVKADYRNGATWKWFGSAKLYPVWYRLYYRQPLAKQ